MSAQPKFRQESVCSLSNEASPKNGPFSTSGGNSERKSILKKAGAGKKLQPASPEQVPFPDAGQRITRSLAARLHSPAEPEATTTDVPYREAIGVIGKKMKLRGSVEGWIGKHILIAYAELDGLNSAIKGKPYFHIRTRDAQLIVKPFHPMSIRSMWGRFQTHYPFRIVAALPFPKAPSTAYEPNWRFVVKSLAWGFKPHYECQAVLMKPLHNFPGTKAWTYKSLIPDLPMKVIHELKRLGPRSAPSEKILRQRRRMRSDETLIFVQQKTKKVLTRTANEESPSSEAFRIACEREVEAEGTAKKEVSYHLDTSNLFDGDAVSAMTKDELIEEFIFLTAPSLRLALDRVRSTIPVDELLSPVRIPETPTGNCISLVDDQRHAAAATNLLDAIIQCPNIFWNVLLHYGSLGTALKYVTKDPDEIFQTLKDEAERRLRLYSDNPRGGSLLGKRRSNRVAETPEAVEMAFLDENGFPNRSLETISDSLRVLLYQRCCEKRYNAPTVLSRNDKGRAVIAGGELKKHDFICEYIGEYISRADISKIRDDIHEEWGAGSYMFYFRNPYDNTEVCIDATEEDVNFGPARLINHSRMRPNITAKAIRFDDNLNRPKLVFVALKDIAPNQELLIDYGETNRKVLEKFPWLATT